MFLRALAFRKDGGEGAQEVTRFDVPDSNVVALIFGREKARALWHVLGHNDGLMRPGYEVLFARGKVDESDRGVEEASLELKGRTAV